MLYQTYAQVDLDAVVANLTAVRERVGPGRRVLAAVKADGYGHGAVPVSRRIQESGAADVLGVATVPEGMELRRAGITLPILKLSPVFDSEAAAAVEHDLTVTVCDEETARIVQLAAEAAGRRAHVHLKVDTGMGRIGSRPEEAPRVAEYIAERCPGLSLDGMFTHLPVSDSAAQDEFTAGQLSVFAGCRSAVESVFGRTVTAHAANSGGVLAHPDSWLDMVRPGVMIYGSYPDPDVARTVALRPALTWRSRVSFVKEVPVDRTIGYGRTWTTSRPTRVATVPVGYGDGYDRRLSNRSQVLIGGARAQVVGRVCMDQLMVDVTDLSPQVRVGDQVVLLGRDGDEEISAAELAALSDTIPYEVTCRIAARVSRRYGD